MLIGDESGRMERDKERREIETERVRRRRMMNGIATEDVLSEGDDEEQRMTARTCVWEPTRLNQPA